MVKKELKAYKGQFSHNTVLPLPNFEKEVAEFNNGEIVIVFKETEFVEWYKKIKAQAYLVKSKLR